MDFVSQCIDSVNGGVCGLSLPKLTVRRVPGGAQCGDMFISDAKVHTFFDIRDLVCRAAGIEPSTIYDDRGLYAERTN